MAHLENQIMRIVQKLSSARLFAPIGAWASAVALGLAIAICASAQSQTVSEPVYAVTYLDVGASSLGRGVDLLKQYRESSRHEAANVEFTVLQETDRPNRFAIVEGWKDQSAFDAHQKAASTAQFEEALEHIDFLPMFANIAQPAVRRLAEASAKEEGVLRYDIYQEPAPHANHFSVVAVWASPKAFDAYETAAPTREFRAAR